MAHNRKLVLGGVALTQVKLPARLTALALGKARDDLEREIIQSSYLEGAPFKWIGLIIRQGLVNEITPHYQKIDQKDGELPLAIEVDTIQFVDASLDKATKIYRKATLLALLHVAEKYGLSAERIRVLFAEMEAQLTEAR
ncbi:hypothetical protein SZ64_10345 [Erythrobacter sp. SG61-1L]|uniref:Imm39 family immunity protein n=1 Tax=Erythrobacter sp. SG61-1L TaxID=1603897 RepID=UPI0006C8ED92|nr:Imm39 family immunity protein [Erythrobacter sp. SG61-1L]KPL68473.1 hypothetical protein SZ64_10345 [Erythrobacter sp. SG61-1L]